MLDTPNDSGQPHTTLPPFTPVPRKCDRSNGWKPEVQLRFIQALAVTGSVTAACRRVGRSTHGAYHLRMHPEAAEFRRAWQAALDIALGRLEDTLTERALYGVEAPVYSYGKLIGHRTVFNDRLAMFILRLRMADRFGQARAMSALDKQAIARLKRQWLAERLREEHEDEQEVFASIDRQLDTMRTNRRANMSPRARAAYEEADRIAKEDGIAWMDAIATDEEVEALALPPPREACPEHSRREAEEEPEAGPRIRTLMDEGW